MSAAEAATLENSLLLIRQETFTVEIGARAREGKMKKTDRGTFDYRGTHYNLSLTDPVARQAFSARHEGDYPLQDVYLCVSLTEGYKEDGRSHKLVAAVIANPPL